ncbi:amine sulfotransferase-like [Pecten maximus]|uniref:amine sulfotransferase-like n=1 Tax=Pecten maximus TaxID=6579 RepID=UPI001458F752|nr:amine sulfotransferase-like [Pecten maximus]
MCDYLEVSDSEGNCIRTKRYQGKPYVDIFVGNIEDHLDRLSCMEVREDDTFVLSYPKSGTHWISSIASMLRTGTSDYIGSPHFLDYNEVDFLEKLPSPRILASHMTFDRLPRQVREGKGKVVVVSRNPKDAAVSLYHFLMKINQSAFKGSWDGFLKFYLDGNMFYGSWFDTFLDWERTLQTYKGDNIMHLLYEDMKQDLLSSVTEIATFLSVTYDVSYLKEVTNKCTFSTMVKTIRGDVKPQDQGFIKVVSNDPLLPIYRKGEVGDWKNHFTVTQNEYFDKIYAEKMKSSTFRFRFE